MEFDKEEIIREYRIIFHTQRDIDNELISRLLNDEEKPKFEENYPAFFAEQAAIHRLVESSERLQAILRILAARLQEFEDAPEDASSDSGFSDLLSGMPDSSSDNPETLEGSRVSD